MGMAIGTKGPQINMTPLIDVLLVLLIIFMVITPTQSVGLNTLAPQPAPEESPARPDTHIVVLVRAGGIVEVNRHPMPLTQLPASLMSVYQGRPDGIVFLTADKDLEYGEVARVIDVVKGAGSYRVGLMPGNAH